jgi:hypothetical protein
MDIHCEFYSEYPCLFCSVFTSFLSFSFVCSGIRVTCYLVIWSRSYLNYSKPILGTIHQSLRLDGAS